MSEPDQTALQELRAEMARLAARVRELERRLGEAAVENAQSPGGSDFVVAELAEGAIPSRTGAAPIEEQIPTGAYQPAARSPVAPPKVRKRNVELDKLAAKSVDWEAVIGERWLTWAGGLTLLLAVGFAVHWAWTTLEAPAWLRVTAFHLLGVGLLIGGGVLWRMAMPPLAAAVSGLGVFTLYAAAYAALHLYEIWPAESAQTIGFAEGALITLLAIVLAVRYNQVGIVLLGALGGYLTPLVVSTGSGDYVALFSYLALLNVALIGSAMWRPWSYVKLIAWGATAALFAAWIFDGMRRQPGVTWPTQWLLVLHGAIFLLGVIWRPLAERKASTTFDLGTLSANSLSFMGFTWSLFHDWPQQQLAWVSWGLALLHLALFGAAQRRVGSLSRLPRVSLALGLLFITLAAPLQIDNAVYWGATWCVQAIVFTGVGLYFADRQLRVAGLIVFLLAAARMFGIDLHAAEELIGPWQVDLPGLMIAIGGLLGLGAGALCLALPPALGRAALPDAESRAICGILGGVGNLLLMVSLLRQWDVSGVAFVWMVDAAVVFWIGFRYGLPAVRSYAAALAILLAGGGTIAGHLFLFEMADLPLIVNRRFGAVCLLALLYGAVAIAYWRLPSTDGDDDRPRETRDRWVHFVFGVLAHVPLLAGMTIEVNEYFRRAFNDGLNYHEWSMARQATTSIVWSAYAALIIVAGFALRYPLFRWLGLLGLAAVVAKVFLVDLAELELLPRVLAFAALGVCLLGVSFVYQRLRRRQS